MLSRLWKKAQDNRRIEGLQTGQERVDISHLQLADDTIVFLEGLEENCYYLLEFLKLYSTISGLKLAQQSVVWWGLIQRDTKF